MTAPTLTERCFACGRPQATHRADTRDGQMVLVGRECWRKIQRAGQQGYQPPLGGPRLYPPIEVAAPTLTERARAVIAGLDDYLVRHGAVFLAAASLPRREVSALAEHRLVLVTSRRSAKLVRFATTDLGREVARLLAEGADA